MISEDEDEAQPGNLAWLRFDAREHDLLRRVPIDGAAAADLLCHAARKLRAGEPLSIDLAEHMARAFDRAARTNGATILHDLGFRVRHRRPAADWIEVGQFIDERSGEDPTDAHFKLAARKFKISPKTARSYWREYHQAVLDARRATGQLKTRVSRRNKPR